MGNQYTKIDEEVKDSVKSENYFIHNDYSRLIGSGLTYKEALENLTQKCKYNGMHDPRKHPTEDRWHCGFHRMKTKNGAEYKEYHPVFFYKRANTCFAYAYYVPFE